jgi:endogenous inhibitor of DNA gyrase (YacG/DUF329 family)
MKPSKPLPEVPCPQCRRRGPWLESPSGPFCSERCRLLDLGQWFEEGHRISRELRPGDFEGFDELTPGDHLDRPTGVSAVQAVPDVAFRRVRGRGPKMGGRYKD